MHWLADIILLAHAGVVLFIVGGAIYIWVGAYFLWPGLYSPAFRYSHVGTMVLVSIETILGLTCPLTILEDTLRGNDTHTGFVNRWVSRLIYYDLPTWVFVLVYFSFTVALVITLIRIPPRPLRPR